MSASRTSAIRAARVCSASVEAVLVGVVNDGGLRERARLLVTATTLLAKSPDLLACAQDWQLSLLCDAGCAYGSALEAELDEAGPGVPPQVADSLRLGAAALGEALRSASGMTASARARGATAGASDASRSCVAYAARFETGPAETSFGRPVARRMALACTLADLARSTDDDRWVLCASSALAEAATLCVMATAWATSGDRRTREASDDALTAARDVAARLGAAGP